MNNVMRPQDYKNAADIPRELTIKEDGFIINLKRSPTEFCIIEDIVVNGCSVYFFDIGSVKDVDPDNAPACGCGDRQFVPKSPTSDILNQLNITLDDYNRLMEILRKHLYVGYCKRCR